MTGQANELILAMLLQHAFGNIVQNRDREKRVPLFIIDRTRFDERPAFRRSVLLLSIANRCLRLAFAAQHAPMGQLSKRESLPLFVREPESVDGLQWLGPSQVLYRGIAAHARRRFIRINNLAVSIIDDNAIGNTLQDNLQLIARLPDFLVQP